MSTPYTGFIGSIILRYIFPFCLIHIGLIAEDQFLHKPITHHSSGQDILITISSLEIHPSVKATIYYRSQEMNHYTELEMEYRMSEWIGYIPGEQVNTPLLEYLILLENNGKEVYAFPEEAPFENPYQIMISPGDQGRTFPSRKNMDTGHQKFINIDMMILSPENGATLEKNQVVIAVSFFHITDIDYESIQLLIDQQDVTVNAEIGDGLLSYVPRNLKSGTHTISVFAKNIHGLELIPQHWSFTVAKHGLNIAEKLVYDGSISSYLSSENVDNEFLNISEIRGKLNAGLNWIQTITDLRITSRDNPYSQSLNRMSTTFKMGDYLTVYTGDIYPNLSPYLIAGKRVRGLGVSVAFSWITLDIISGDINRAVQWGGKTDHGFKLHSHLTTINNGGGYTYDLDRTGYTFLRSVDTYRLSMNYNSTYYLGAYFLKSKDDVHSVYKDISSSADFTVDTLAYGLTPGVYTLDEFQSAVDEANGIIQFSDSKWGGGDPEENLVIGLDTKAYFDQRQLSAEFSWNFSLHNRNIWDGAITLAELDTTLDDSLDGLIGTQYDENGLITGVPLMIDTTKLMNPTDYESIFTINQYMTPLFFYDALAYEDHPIATIVNMPSAAFHLKINGRYPVNNYSIEYRQVGPYYTSFGNPYLTTNIREFSLYDRIALLDYKLILSAGYTYQDNDIVKTEINPLRSHIFSTNIMLIPGPNVPSFTINLQSMNRKRNYEDFTESLDLRENTLTSNTAFSVNLPFIIKERRNILSLNFNMVSNSDLLSKDRLENYVFTKSNTNIISANLLNTILPNLRTKLLVYRAEITLPGFLSSKLTRSSMGLDVHYSTLNNTLRMIGHLSIISSSGMSDLNLFNGKIGCEMDVWDNITARLSGNLQVYGSDMVEINDGTTSAESEENQNKSYEINTSGLQLSIQYKF